MLNTGKYRIVICTPAIYSAGGVERVVSVKANYFAEQLGYDVIIILTDGKGRDSFFPISDHVKIVNYELNFESLWSMPFWKKVLVYLQKQWIYRRRLKKDLLRIRPDFTISTLRREINFITGVNDGSYKIGELHVNRANYRSFDKNYSNAIKCLFARFWMNNLLGKLRKLDKLVVLSDNARDDWPELGNVIKIQDPLPLKIEAKSELSSKRIISIGRYAYDKGNDLLLQAWAIIQTKCSDWTLDVYGNGDRTPYQNQMLKFGIDPNRCHLLGPTKDVKKEYLGSSLFVLPSRFEGFGLVLIESMACGVPVVSFDCENGPRSIITEGVDGFLISPFDVDAFVEKVILLIKNENLRKEMGENARQSVAKYDIDIVGQQWKHLFDDLMQKNVV